MISKAVSVGAYESAVIIYRLDGKELCRKCTRCQKRDPRKRTQFNKHHGPGKCPVVASLPHMAPQDMDVDAAAAGHGEGGATLSYCSSNAARGLAGVSAKGNKSKRGKRKQLSDDEDSAEVGAGSSDVAAIVDNGWESGDAADGSEDKDAAESGDELISSEAGELLDAAADDAAAAAAAVAGAAQAGTRSKRARTMPARLKDCA